MPGKSVSSEIVLCHEDPVGIREALARGEVDAAYPAVEGFLDRFDKFLRERGFFSLLQDLPDERKRQSVPAFFYGNVLLHKEVLRLESFAEVGDVLFRSPAVLRSLGFNVRQMYQGFYQNGQVKPFNQEALCDYFAQLDQGDLLRHQESVARWLWNRFPALRHSQSAQRDCVDVKVRRCRPEANAITETVHYKFCVLSLCAEGEVVPVLWNYTEDQERSDLTLGKELLETALRILGPKPFEYLLIDRGYLDGGWMAELLEAHGVHTILRLKENMTLFHHLLSRRHAPDHPWRSAEPPKLRDHEIPTRRIAGFECPEGLWESFPHPLRACLIEDTYSDMEATGLSAIVYQAVVATELDQSLETIHQRCRDRGEIEESFMTISRYWALNEIGPCRPRVGFSQAHFTFLGYTLLTLFRQFEAQQQWEPSRPQLTAGREVVVYWRDRYAVLFLSELVAIILQYSDTWRSRERQILEALRLAEGHQRAPP